MCVLRPKLTKIGTPIAARVRDQFRRNNLVPKLPGTDAMLAQFSIYPTDTTHMSRDIAQLLDILDKTGIEYRLGPMATSIEGDWEHVMDAIRQCH
jgi:Thiamine-binding protein